MTTTQMTVRDFRVLDALRGQSDGLTIGHIVNLLDPSKWNREAIKASVNRLVDFGFVTYAGLVVSITDDGRMYARHAAPFWRGRS